MALVALSCGYYLLHVLLAELERRDMCVWRLRAIVAYARISHPYLASLISLSVIYHVYVMWMTHILDVKVFSGIAVSTMVALMANSGWALRFRPRIRQLHQLGMYLLFLVLAGHRLL